MTSYKILPNPDGTNFNVEVVSLNGAHQTILAFATEADAEAWIASDKARDEDAGRPEPRDVDAGKLD
jgi:hypothetical protein